MKTLVLSLFVIFGTNAFADPVEVSCRGGGASQDRFVYDVIFKSNVFDDSMAFHIYADGKGPGEQYDIGNRFSNIWASTRMIRNHSGRPYSVEVSGRVLPNNRQIKLFLDLSVPNSFAELELMREDGSFIFAHLSCQTKLPQHCRDVTHCWKHCHPMVGCERICDKKRVCEPGKYASDD